MAEIQRQAGPRLIVYETFMISDKIDRLAEAMGLSSPAYALGPVLRIYLYFEKRSTTNMLRGPLGHLKRKLDAEADHKGTVEAMESIGLLRCHPDGVEFVNYIETVGRTYKLFCQEAQQRGKKGGGRPPKPAPPANDAKVKTVASTVAEALVGSGRDRSGQDESCQLVRDVGDGPPGELTPHFHTAAFQRFLKDYPANRRSKKNDAWEQWRRAFAGHVVTQDNQVAENPELLARILASLAKWCQSEQWQRDGGKYVPNPANWLADRPWDDDPPPPAKPTPAELPRRTAAELQAALEARRKARPEPDSTPDPDGETHE